MKDLNFNPGIGLGPVSYTHLDVYKRQVPGLGAILLNNTIGERVEAISPANLGYGYYDYRGIPAGSTLIFTYTIEKFN